MSIDAPAHVAVHVDRRTTIAVVAVSAVVAALVATISRTIPVELAIGGLLGAVAVVVVAADPIRALIAVALVRAVLEATQDRPLARVLGLGVSVADVVTIAVLIGCVAWLVARGSAGVAVWRAPTFAPAVALVALATVSLSWSASPALGIRDLVKFAAAYAVYLVIVAARPDPRRLRTLLAAVVAGAVVPIVYAFWNLANGVGRPGALHGGLRIESTFGHPNTFGFYLVVVATAAWGLRWLVEPRRRRLVDAVGVGALVATAFTLSRNAWAALSILVVVVGWRHRAVLWTAAVAAVAVVAAAPRLLTRATDFLQTPEGEGIGNSLLGRLELWGRDLELWRAQPLSGRGWGSTLASVDVAAHSDVLRALVEIGLVGLVAFVLLQWSLVATAVRRGRRRGDLPRAFLGLALGYVAISATSNTSGKGAFLFAFWAVAGISVVMSSLPDLSAPSPRRLGVVGGGGDGEGPSVAPDRPGDPSRAALVDVVPPRGGAADVVDPARAVPDDVEPPGVRSVMLVVSTLDGSGPGRVMATIARHLVQEGLEATLVATHGPVHSAVIERTRTAGVRVEHLAMRGMLDPRGPAAFRRLLRDVAPDIVHTRTIRADLIGRHAAREGVAVVNNIVNVYPDDLLTRLGPVGGRAAMRRVRATVDRVDRFVANAASVAANVRVAFGVPDDRIAVVYDGIENERARPAEPADLRPSGVPSDARVCLTIARLHPQKGLDDLLTAALSIPGDVRFVIAGDGPEHERLASRIEAERLSRVTLLGEREDVATLLARADLLVMPSRFEGLPTAILEAQVAGVPVVATDVGGNAEVVHDGATGWIVPPGDPRALAAAIERALASDLDAVGAEAARRAERAFSANAMTAAFLEVYRDVVAARRRVRVGARSVGAR